MRPYGETTKDRAGPIALLTLPVLTVALGLMAWVTAVSRSGFWADDFLNVTHYANSLGDLTDDHFNQGKYVSNLFWALGAKAFGNGSVVPFLLLNSLVFALGVVIWLRAGVGTRWSAVSAWWVGGLFIATSAWLPTTLWSSNIVHSAGFLALGGAMLAHRRSLRSEGAREALLWSAATGLTWTLAVVSNLLYIGLLPIAIYCGAHEALTIREQGVDTRRAAVAVGLWTLVAPIVYFAAVAYPSTTANSAYAKNGLHFVHYNFNFYESLLAPTGLLLAVYIVVVGLALAGAVLAARERDWFPLAVLAAAAGTTVPALVQSQQRDIHYMAMPLLLTFSALVMGLRPVLTGRSQALVRAKVALTIGGAIALFLLFRQGGYIRSYFVETPYGHNLLAFRDEVAALTGEGGTICAAMELDASEQSLFSAEMSGPAGFAVGPIHAAQTYLLAPGATCPVGAAATRITIALNARGNFVARSSPARGQGG